MALAASLDNVQRAFTPCPRSVSIWCQSSNTTSSRDLESDCQRHTPQTFYTLKCVQWLQQGLQHSTVCTNANSCNLNIHKLNRSSSTISRLPSPGHRRATSPFCGQGLPLWAGIRLLDSHMQSQSTSRASVHPRLPGSSHLLIKAFDLHPALTVAESLKIISPHFCLQTVYAAGKLSSGICDHLVLLWQGLLFSTMGVSYSKNQPVAFGSVTTKPS